MGVFIPAFNLQDLDLGIFSLNSNQQLFLLGGIAIAIGILTYSKKVMETIGGNIVELSSEAALVVVLAQAMVLFIFSSSGLSNLFISIGLPPIPMVPVSSSQVIVGCVLGIGLYSGARNINFRILGEIALGWLATPIVSGLLAFFSLYFMKNIFSIDVGGKKEPVLNSSAPVNDSVIYGGSDISVMIKYILFGVFIFGTIGLIFYALLERKKKKNLQKSEERFWMNMK